jgi:hypothetical protein
MVGDAASQPGTRLDRGIPQIRDRLVGCDPIDGFALRLSDKPREGFVHGLLIARIRTDQLPRPFEQLVIDIDAPLGHRFSDLRMQMVSGTPSS